MKKIYTIQHTESIHHKNKMVGSWTDWSLTEFGLEQADKIGKNLFTELNTKVVIYSSDLLRAKQTAESINKYFKCQIHYHQELRERNLGEAIGKSLDWYRKNVLCEENSIDDRLFTGAETKRDEYNRLLPLFNEIINSSDEIIFIVSHGDILSVFNNMWLNLGVESLNSIDLYGFPGGVSLLVDNGKKRAIRKLSDMSYQK